ncbi:hypothetical protein [Paenibacillus cisolokensis]|nr:hypothetical protein [Paenibacillus cisolokensis]
MSKGGGMPKLRREATPGRPLREKEDLAMNDFEKPKNGRMRHRRA